MVFSFVPANIIYISNLTLWATNGVLMLNTCLTVKSGNPGSHSNKGWETFTEHVLRVVDKYGGANLPKSENGASSVPGFGRGVVFVAWGSWAQKRVAGLNKVRHLILPANQHPIRLQS
jgi:uracil-DNA glycosylase